MSVIKISQLPSKTTPPSENDLLAVVDSVEVTTKKISVKNLFTNSTFTGTVTIDNLDVTNAITGDINANNVDVNGLFSLATGPEVNAILTDFSGSSATSLATQKAIKDYVDSRVGVSETFAEVLTNGNETLGTNIVVTATDSILVDTIAETTTDAGVTIDSVLLKDGLVSGRNVSTDGVKLDGIEPGADVTDATNVQAAGALMDSELTNEAAVKALDQGVSTTDSPTFTTLILDDGTGSVGIGDSALSANTGASNTAIGDLTLDAGGSGGNNTALGRAALTSNTTGTQNTGLGRSSLLSNEDGDANTAVGVQALELNVSGDSNTGIGVDSLEASTGNQNSGLGRLSGSTLVSGNNNTFVGYNAQPSSTTVSNEVTIGDIQIDTFRIPGIGVSWTASTFTYAGGIDVGTVTADALEVDSDTLYVQSGTARVGINTASPATSLDVGGSIFFSGILRSTSGGSAASPSIQVGLDGDTGLFHPASNNIGFSTLATERMRITSSGLVGINTSSPTEQLHVIGKMYLEDAYNSVGIGQSALSGSTGLNNVAVGRLALDAGDTGGQNVAVGAAALTSNTSGNLNTGIGRSALLLNTTGTTNTAVGAQALLDMVSANGCTAVGYRALYNATNGLNTAVGREAGSTTTTGQNNSSLGYNANPSSATASNQITLGNTSIASLRCAVTSITSISDERDKDNIQPLVAGIDFINELNPVSFTWNCRDGSKIGQSEIGFTAQQLQQAQQTTGIEIPNLVFDDNPDKLEATYGALIPVIVKALKDLKAENDDLKARLSALESGNANPSD